MRDRGFMVVFGAISAGLYAVFAFTPITYATLLVAVMLLTTSFLFVASAQNGLTSTIGQQHAMSGQISAAWNIFLSVPALAAFLIGGHLSDLLEQPEHRSGRPHSVSRRCRDHGLRGRLRRVETQQRVRQCPHRAGDRSAPHRGPREARAALADLPGSADLAVVELRARLGHAAPVLPAEHAPRRGRPMGSVERHLLCVLHSDVHAVRRSLPQASLEDPAFVGDGRRHPAAGSVALHAFGDGSIDRGGAHRPHGRRGHRRLSGPDHSLLPLGVWRGRR